MSARPHGLLAPIALSLLWGGCVLDPGECGPPLAIPDGNYVAPRESCAPVLDERLAREVHLRMDAEAGYVYVEYEIEALEGTRKIEERWKIVKRDGVPRD